MAIFNTNGHSRTVLTPDAAPTGPSRLCTLARRRPVEHVVPEDVEFLGPLLTVMTFRPEGPGRDLNECVRETGDFCRYIHQVSAIPSRRGGGKRMSLEDAAPLHEPLIK